MTKQAAELTYAVRFSVLAKYFGQLCLVVAALTVMPLAVSLICGEFRISFRYTIVIAALAGLGSTLGRMRAPVEVQVNEAMVIVAFMFLFTPLVMTFPVMGSGLTFPDALFETISAATTTGLSTVKNLQDQPRTFLFARAWMQWYGGLGIVVLTVALLFRPGTETKKFAVTEAREEDLVGGTKAHARRVLIVYTLLSVAGFLLLLVVGTGPFNAVLYSLAAVSTGGFAPHDASLAALSGPLVDFCVILICLTGAVPLSFYHRLYKKDPRPNSDTMQLRWINYMGVLISLLPGISMAANGKKTSPTATMPTLKNKIEVSLSRKEKYYQESEYV